MRIQEYSNPQVLTTSWTTKTEIKASPTTEFRRIKVREHGS